jgi:hypothetical protein
VAPVDASIGGRLNRAAVGWSRQPLHNCVIDGRWGRRKHWDYWCVTTGSHLVTCTYADLDYLGLASVWFLDLATGLSVEKSVAIPLGLGIDLPNTVGGDDIHFSAMGLRFSAVEEDDGTHLEAEFRKGGDEIDINLVIESPAGHESLNVLVPWTNRTFQFTSKHCARPARGIAVVGNDSYTFGGADNQAFGTLDFGCGVWPYRSSWNWGSGSGVCGGQAVGLQFGGKWTDGTGVTENGLVIGGRLHKISEDLIWDYDSTDWKRPWRIRTPRSPRVDLTFEPTFERASAANALVMSTAVHQCFGHWSGSVVDDGGAVVDIEDVFGWAEEARWKW